VSKVTLVFTVDVYLDGEKVEGEMVKPARQVRESMRKTVCKYGHALTGDNVYERPDRRGRQCRACAARRKVEQDVRFAREGREHGQR
jgi:hypothetical protein